MAITNGYCTLEELKGRLGNRVDATDDTKFEQIIEAASRQIDGLCNRIFSSAAAETRIFTAECWDFLAVDDLVSITSLTTDEQGNRTYTETWTADDYDLEPYNNAARNWPYTHLRLNPNTTNAFPTIRRGVKITGTWGWPAVPDAVTEACLLIAVRLVQTAKAPFGVAGTAPDGQVQYSPRVDPIVRQLLDPYRRFLIGAV